MDFILTLVILILMLGIIIFVHEFAHFISAKKIGVYVDEFSLGMGPVILKHKPKNSETTYSLRIFPIGGYVSMADKEVKERKIKKDRVLENKSFIEKFIVLIAGIVFNCISAIILFFISGLIYGSPVNEPYIGAVLKDSPAEQAGIVSGDKIEKINGVKVENWDDIILELSAKELKDNYEFLIIKQNGTKQTYNIKPIVTQTEEGETRSFGISSDAAKKEKGFIPALKYGITGFIDNSKTIFRILGSLFTGEVKMASLSGPVGIFGVINEVKSQGLEILLYLTAYLSINVAIINLIPIPVFDGGRILLIVIEKITKKKTNEKIENALNLIGFGLMIILMIFVTFNDIIKLFWWFSMENRYLNNKIVLKYSPDYYRIINEDFDELDYITDRLINIYQTYIFSIDATNKQNRKQISKINKIMVKYFDDRNFKKELTNMLISLKVPKNTQNVIVEIIKAIEKTYEKYMEGFTRNLYIPKWI